MFTKRKVILIVLLLSAVAGLWLFWTRRVANHHDPSSVLATKDISNPPVLRLKEGLLPPTNKWFSSLVFAPSAQPVYPLPLSFKPGNDHLEVGLPKVTAAPNTITAPHIAGFKLAFGADEYRVEAYDDLSVTLVFLKQGKAMLETRLVRGSPYVFLTARDNISQMRLDGSFQAANGDLVSDNQGGSYGLSLSDGELRDNQFDLKKGQQLTIFVAPSQMQLGLLQLYAHNVVTETAVTATIDDQTLTTGFSYTTANDQATLAALPPLHGQADQPSSLAYETLLGRLDMCIGNSFEAIGQVGLPDETRPKLDQQELSAVREALKEDIAKDEAVNTIDAYFAGKSLTRLAELLRIATHVDSQLADQLADKLQQELDVWLAAGHGETDKFYYEPRLKGVVAGTPSFGSEDFNDHHFHYGYFIYAASVLGEYAPETVNRYEQTVDLLVADIANHEASDHFLRLRYYDPYDGHSWASGYGIFADGNNQESSSEAVHAWYGVYLWGRLKGDENMEKTGKWLYSTESKAALYYWLQPPSAYMEDVGTYGHNLVSLVWSGKVDYATFFSPRPQAKLGIQLLPFTVSQQYLSQLSAEQSQRMLAEVAPKDEDYNGQFGSYLVMLLAQADKAKAAKLATRLSEKSIDEATSKTALLYYLYGQ